MTFCLAGLVTCAAADQKSGKKARALALEAMLIWGTDEEKSPDPNHKPAEQEVEKKLKGLPLKWKNYFEVNRQSFTVQENATATVQMSKDCSISVKYHGQSKVEVTLIGKGEPVTTITQALPPGELLVLGGNAPNMTGWFVVIRQAAQ